MHTTTLTKPDRRARGTSLLEYFNCSYNDLVNMLGEPTCADTSPDGKTHKEWHVQIMNDSTQHHMLTIYDYKQPTDPAIVPDMIVEWHVGGKHDQHWLALDLIEFIT